MLLTGTQIESKRNHRTLFKALNFELDAGQLLLVEGHNGSGKTTLLKTLAGLREPDAGQVLWGAGYRPQFVWLGHANGIKDDLTALENLRAMQTNSLPPKTVLERMGLAGHGNRFPRHFSAGMKRRLALCRLLLSDAPLWILDEPQAALDKAGIRLFEALLSEHLQQGGSVVMTSHHDIGLEGQHIRRLGLGT